MNISAVICMPFAGLTDGARIWDVTLTKESGEGEGRGHLEALPNTSPSGSATGAARSGPSARNGPRLLVCWDRAGKGRRICAALGADGPGELQRAPSRYENQDWDAAQMSPVLSTLSLTSMGCSQDKKGVPVACGAGGSFPYTSGWGDVGERHA